MMNELFEGSPTVRPESKLILSNGMVFEGFSFGSSQSVAAGEVVFHTGMVGYIEALTDPSYYGQILILTYPLIGNYGVPDASRDELGILKNFEGERIYAAGLIVAGYCDNYSHRDAIKSLSDWLKEYNISALCGIDTRMITKILRETGPLLGKIEQDNSHCEFYDPSTSNLSAFVSVSHVKMYGDKNATKIIAFDCGMKLNMLRMLLRQGCCVFVVPYNYDLESNPEMIPYDGIFISNGPGDPALCKETIISLRYALSLTPPKPIFGICLGHQLLALAAGAKTYKMKYGNRSMNQPCIDLRSAKCYMTSQNHGYAVNHTSLPSEWKSLFLNANDMTNEGIIHQCKPFFSVQFHPEASGGPHDTMFLFTEFVDLVQSKRPQLTLLDPMIYHRPIIRKVLLIGSGGLSIGQAGEFDYSGSQACKALKEENVEVILLNPNIATVQTSNIPGVPAADKVYFLPIRCEVVEEIISKERPDGIIISMGGQTALNVGVELWKAGILEKYSCRVLGTSIESIILTEDREKFAEKLQEIDQPMATSFTARSLEEADEIARKIGYPVLIRAAYALGGLGSGFAHDETELHSICSKAFAISSQLLIDQDLRGWKEIEYEVMRDCKDNCVTICNMENFDPVGVHTGDSIVVAPSQTLSDKEYFTLREVSIRVIRHLQIIGECNIQFAVDPFSDRYCIIEVNARLSRSSALASKATGYPLAYLATKLALGKDLIGLKNAVNKLTTACCEPTLDYCVVKIPRWDLGKFSKVSKSLGSAMCSVGEVMSIGRTFEEAIQKAVRMVSSFQYDGLEGFMEECDPSELLRSIATPTDQRLFHIQQALEIGCTVEDVYNASKIDKWFLYKLQNIARVKHRLCEEVNVNGDYWKNIDPYRLKYVKAMGFSDRQLARYWKCSESIVRSLRQRLGVVPMCKQVDTLAAEYPSHTNYLYLTYFGNEHDSEMVTITSGNLHRESEGSLSSSSLWRSESVTRVGISTSEAALIQSYTSDSATAKENCFVDNPSSQLPTVISFVTVANQPSSRSESPNGVIVLGCGAYCIGSSVEFDWCAVSAISQIRQSRKQAIIINYNPETVSTDFDVSDKLYFEELSLERVLDIYELECPMGLIVSVGGQIPNNLVKELESIPNDVHILGTHPSSIQVAENRQQFSQLLDQLGVDQPIWSELTTLDEARTFAKEVGYPVIVRPSYVLSGAAMAIISAPDELEKRLEYAAHISSDQPVVISKFIANAKEIEFDGVARQGIILNYAISEHIENAGVHSGDATLVLPAQKLYAQTVRLVKSIAAEISRALNITGPFNIQFLAKGNEVKVIECNLRASRSFPFVSKALRANFITLATKVMLFPETVVRPYQISLYDMEYVAVKAPMFSFGRLQMADPTLGIEMGSTGEVACFGKDLYEAFLQSLLATGFKLPSPSSDKYVLLSIAVEDVRREFITGAKSLIRCGYKLAGTPGTAAFYSQAFEGTDYTIVRVEKPPSQEANAVDWIKRGSVDLVINIPEGTNSKDEVTAGYLIRRAAVDYGVSLITNLKCAILLCESITKCKVLPVKCIEDYVGDSE